MNINEEYWKFTESEKHFNEIQSGIRNLASGWMLAAFAGIALLLKTDNSNVQWLISPALLVGIISLMATLGLLVLWINDQLVYQRLLNAGFLVALNLEYRNKSLPPIRTTMRYATENKKMSRWMTHFYTIPLWGFCAISFAAILLRKGIGDRSVGIDSDQTFWILSMLCAGQSVISLWVHKREAEVGVETRAAAFDDKNFEALFNGTPKERRISLAAVIKRYQPAG